MFRYETHLHTCLTSACSKFAPQEIVDKYLSLGYAGVFVTDHFLNGNTTVEKNMTYESQIENFCKGYLAVKECAEHTPLDVFFGFEYSYRGTDFLVYGLDETWLKAHEVVMRLTTKEFCRYAREQGGLVVQAHPCREDWYIDHVRLFPSDVDGFEVRNACRKERENYLAQVYAEQYALKQTAGSDIHFSDQTVLAGMEFETKLVDEKDYCARILAGEGKIFTLNTKN